MTIDLAEYLVKLSTKYPEINLTEVNDYLETLTTSNASEQFQEDL